MDTQDRKRDAEARERRFELVFDSLPAMTVLFAVDGVITHANKRFLTYSGETLEQVRQGACGHTLHPHDRPDFLTRFRQALKAGEPLDCEVRVRRSDGVYRWHQLQSTAVLDADGRVELWCGLFTDIDDTRRAEVAAREYERRFRQVVDDSPSIIGLFDPDGSMIFANRRALEYHGQTFEQLKWSVLRGFNFHVDERAEIGRRFLHALRSGEPFGLEVRLIDADGFPRWHLMQDYPLRDAEGRIEMWCAAFTDIHDARRAAEALTRARAELNHVARATALSALTASIAHEVNQPLAGIITNASTCLRMLAADPPNIEGARATARRTIRDGNRASEVIQRLRALFARKGPRIEPVDLNDTAQEVLALSAAELQRRRVIVRTDFDENAPAVQGDRVQLQQVILNLVLNAADAMNAVDDRPRDLLVATARGDQGRVRLSVTDAGAGFDPADAGRLFDPFYTTKAEGMGIGLWISRSIVESHEGCLAVAANDGPGATFSFWLPATTEPAAGPRAGPGPPLKEE